MEAHLITGRELEEDVAFALELASVAKDVGGLPGAGGILDQDPRMMVYLEAGLFGIHKYEAYQQKQASKARPKRRG